MHLPTVANRVSFLYASGNTPATNLARCVPHGQDADVLSLGCGDVRNILYTCYTDKGLAPRKLDVTCCDYDDRIIVRIVILFTLILDQERQVANEVLWDIFYHLYVNGRTATILQNHLEKLLPCLQSLREWHSCRYGQLVRFCDQATLNDVRRHCTSLLDAASNPNSESSRATFKDRLRTPREYNEKQFGNSMVVTGMRSAAPLSLQSKNALPACYEQYWKDGTVTPVDGQTTVPNPMFASLLSDESSLHYGTDPVLGFHLAMAFAPLSQASPLNVDESSTDKLRVADAAKTQFSAWIEAFREKCRSGTIVVRFVAADVFACCHTLQHVASAGKTCANWYRRQWDSKRLALDDDTYGTGEMAPTAFDMIDTSNLSDHVGALNILISTVPLLKETPWATISTEILLKQHHGKQQTLLDHLLRGDAATMSLLLGVSSVPYWTNAKCESHVDEVFMGLMGQSSSSPHTQLHDRLAWKRDDQLSGQRDGKPALQVDAKSLARVLFQVYLAMFEEENVAYYMEMMNRGAGFPYSHFHRGTFASFLKFVKSRVRTDWQETCVCLMDAVAQDQSRMLGTNFMQELCAQLHLMDVFLFPEILQGISPSINEGPLRGWKSFPVTAAVTVVVPRTAIQPLYTGSDRRKVASPSFVGSLRASGGSKGQWHNIFADVHIVFGSVRANSADSSENTQISIEEDPLGWSGSSSLIATFTVPMATLQVEPATALAGVVVPSTGHNSVVYAPVLGPSMTVFETKLANASAVYITQHSPGLSGNRIVCAGGKPLEPATADTKNDTTTRLSAEIQPSESKVTSVTGHLDILGSRGKQLVKDKASIQLLQNGPYVIDVVFGNRDLVLPLRFPIPVTTDGSKTRIARTSGYVEVVAPIAKPLESPALVDFFLPSSLGASGLPAVINTPCLNLDNLPVVDLQKKSSLQWLTTLTSLTFSTRERALRDVFETSSGLAENPRINIKESMFTMFMLSSGLQGGQTGMFAITHPERGGIHMLLFVSAMRLDGDTASVVLDAAVLPFTMDLIMSGKIEEFLLLIRTLECGSITVNDNELDLWKKCLPSMAERCRTWSHKPSCEYKKSGARIPLSLGQGKQIICSCGSGQLPRNFVSIPEWDTVVPYVTRIAISPVYAVPLVEEVADLATYREQGASENALRSQERCRTCAKTEGAGGTGLKKCMRCQSVKYCSAECQKKDWKKHRMECEEA